MQPEYRFNYQVAKPNRFADQTKVEWLVQALNSKSYQIVEGRHIQFSISKSKEIDMSSEAITARLKLTGHLTRLCMSWGKAKLSRRKSKQEH